MTPPQDVKKLGADGKKYTAALYDEEGYSSAEETDMGKEYEVDIKNKGPRLMESEISFAIHELKMERLLERTTYQWNFGNAWRRRQVPNCQDFAEISKIKLKLFHKANTTACKDHALDSPSYRILLKVLIKKARDES